MIYEPSVDNTAKIIQMQIEYLGRPYGSHESAAILKSLGKPSIHYVLRAIEHPISSGPEWYFASRRDYLMSLLKWFAEQEMMSMDELQRYRQILTSEKKEHAT
jgi:hypothetical protein